MGEKTPAPLSLHLPSPPCVCVCTQVGSSKFINQPLKKIAAQTSEKTQKAEGRGERGGGGICVIIGQMIKVDKENVIPARLPLLLFG